MIKIETLFAITKFPCFLCSDPGICLFTYVVKFIYVTVKLFAFIIHKFSRYTLILPVYCPFMLQILLIFRATVDFFRQSWNFSAFFCDGPGICIFTCCIIIDVFHDSTIICIQVKFNHITVFLSVYIRVLDIFSLWNLTKLLVSNCNIPRYRLISRVNFLMFAFSCCKFHWYFVL